MVSNTSLKPRDSMHRLPSIDQESDLKIEGDHITKVGISLHGSESTVADNSYYLSVFQ